MTAPSAVVADPVYQRSVELGFALCGLDGPSAPAALRRGVEIRVRGVVDQRGAPAVEAWLEGLLADGWCTLGPSDITRLAGRGIPQLEEEATGAA